MKTKTPLTKILYRTAAIAFMVLGLWLVYRFFLYSLKFDNNSAAETSFTLFVALSYILHGVVSLIISFHLFRLDNIGKTITLVLLISFIVSAFFNFYISFAFVLFLVIIVLIQRKNVSQDQFQIDHLNISVSKQGIFSTGNVLALGYKTLLGFLVGYISILNFFPVGDFRWRLFLFYEILFYFFYSSRIAYYTIGNFVFIAALIGGEISFFMTLKEILFNHYSKVFATKIVYGAFWGLITIMLFFCGSIIQNNNQILSTYANYCTLILDDKPKIAYDKYFSPQFKEIYEGGKKDVDHSKRAFEYELYCIDRPTRVFISSFGNTGVIFPEASIFTPISELEWHPVILTSKENGKWYLSGRGAFQFNIDSIWVSDYQ